MNKFELSRYQNLVMEIAKLDEELMALEASAVRPSDLSGMPHASGISDKVGNLAVKMAELTSMIQAQRKKLIEARCEIEDYINSIKEDKMRIMFRLKYINGMGWDKVSEEMGYDVVYLRQMHSTYLAKAEKGTEN